MPSVDMLQPQNFSGLIQQLVQKENQVLELQEEVAKLSSKAPKGSPEEVS